MSVPGGIDIVYSDDTGIGPITLSIPKLPKAAHPEADALDLWRAFLWYDEDMSLDDFQRYASNVDSSEAAQALKALRQRYSSLTKKQINELDSKQFEAENPELVAKAKRRMAKGASRRSKKALQRATKAIRSKK